jgi:hypothetical protein
VVSTVVIPSRAESTLPIEIETFVPEKLQSSSMYATFVSLALEAAASLSANPLVFFSEKNDDSTMGMLEMGRLVVELCLAARAKPIIRITGKIARICLILFYNNPRIITVLKNNTSGFRVELVTAT